MVNKYYNNGLLLLQHSATADSARCTLRHARYVVPSTEEIKDVVIEEEKKELYSDYE